jgi:hypothetical protein
VAMNSQERAQVQELLGHCLESDQPEQGNMAVFYDDNDSMVYAGIIKAWPEIIATDIEWGKVELKDTTKEPFLGKKVRFFEPQQFTKDLAKKTRFMN